MKKNLLTEHRIFFRVTAPGNLPYFEAEETSVSGSCFFYFDFSLKSDISLKKKKDQILDRIARLGFRGWKNEFPDDKWLFNKSDVIKILEERTEPFIEKEIEKKLIKGIDTGNLKRAYGGNPFRIENVRNFPAEDIKSNILKNFKLISFKEEKKTMEIRIHKVKIDFKFMISQPK